MEEMALNSPTTTEGKAYQRDVKMISDVSSID